MTTITLSLPDEVAARAKALSPDALTELIRRALDLPPGFDPRLIGKVDPSLFGSVVTVGDIVSPLDEAWKAEQ